MDSCLEKVPHEKRRAGSWKEPAEYEKKISNESIRCKKL